LRYLDWRKAMLYFFAPTEIDPKSTRDLQLKLEVQETSYPEHWGHGHTTPGEDKLFDYIDSSIIPTLSIFMLYYVRSPPARLGLVLVSTTMFACVLQLVVRARALEVFADTGRRLMVLASAIERGSWLTRRYTRFTVVQVVFVGSTIGSLNHATLGVSMMSQERIILKQ